MTSREIREAQRNSRYYRGDRYRDRDDRYGRGYGY